MSLIRNVLAKVGLSDRRKNARVLAHGLDVSYWTGLEQKQVKIKDISTTGLYMLTSDRWLPGAPVQLILEKRGVFEKESQPQVRLRARCARLGDDGVGLTFIEEPARASEWSKSMDIAAELFADSHPVRLFRAAKAFFFLLRVCPSAEVQVLQLIAGLNCEKAERTIDICVQAEELLTARPPRTDSGLLPNLVLRILEDGSKASEKEVQQCWAGLLASSCLHEMQDSSLRLAALLSKLDRDHVAILSAACVRAIRGGWRAGSEFASVLYCSADEIRKIAGIRNLVAIERNLNHLHHLGLLGKTERPMGCAQLDEVNITPTSLGLKLYVRCGGQMDISPAVECSSLEMAS